jgi:hypothetical protein
MTVSKSVVVVILATRLHFNDDNDHDYNENDHCNAEADPALLARRASRYNSLIRVSESKERFKFQLSFHLRI